MRNNDHNFGHNLKVLRLQLGLSQMAAAASAQLTNGSISQYERGVCDPSLAHAIRLAGVLDVPLAVLTGARLAGPT
jgi:transcriptional regulator with XRE-family HTH domain